MIYDAMENRFKDEVYLKVDAQEGEDFSKDEIHGLGVDFDIKGKENHNISADKLSQISTPTGNNVIDVVQYIYNRLLEKNPAKEKIIKSMNSDLSEMLDYLNEKNKISIKNVVKKAIKDGVSIEDVRLADKENDSERSMEEFTKDE